MTTDSDGEAGMKETVLLAPGAASDKRAENVGVQTKQQSNKFTPLSRHDRIHCNHDETRQS